MSVHERTGFRSLVYSKWHREGTRALLGARRAHQLKMVDIDSCEACTWCSMPVALIETAHTKNQPKTAPITMLLARMAGIPAYSVSYWGDIDRGRCTACDRGDETGDIHHFLIRRIEPPEQRKWIRYEHTPYEYATFLESLRDEHYAVCPRLRQEVA